MSAEDVVAGSGRLVLALGETFYLWAWTELRAAEERARTARKLLLVLDRQLHDLAEGLGAPRMCDADDLREEEQRGRGTTA